MANFSFVALDVETATGQRSSICEIGIAVIEDSEIKESKSWLIQPDGNVCPCIAFPMRAGNARTDNLKDIYNSVTFNNIRNLKYRDSDRCGKESYCKWCNRCIGQSYIATGNAANASEDNCFIARLIERISLENREKQ